MNNANASFYVNDRTHKLHIRLSPPGEFIHVVDRPATEQDQKNYSRQYGQFTKGEEQTPDGHPIDLVQPNNPKIAALLKSNGVYTLEQCTNLSGHALGTIGMGAQSWSNEAKRLLQEANKSVTIGQFKVLERRFETLEHEIMELKLKKRAKI